ncbi:MAG: hypothetical protein JJU45_16025 [Acidimicrobiia bacterium]|nr:hypothetical protein [Acidimicrobiia bacterium]
MASPDKPESFPIVKKGYDPDVVQNYVAGLDAEIKRMKDYFNRAIERAEAAEEAVAAAKLAQSEAETRLGTLEAEVGAATARALDAEQRLDDAKAQLAAAPTRSDAPVEDEAAQAAGMLALAQKTADAAVAEAREKAQATVSEADQRAAEMLSVAEARAEELRREARAEADSTLDRARREAQERRAAEVGALREDLERLGEVRDALAADVDALSEHLEAERERLRGVVAGIVAALDDPAGLRSGERPGLSGVEPPPDEAASSPGTEASDDMGTGDVRTGDDLAGAAPGDGAEQADADPSTASADESPDPEPAGAEWSDTRDDEATAEDEHLVAEAESIPLEQAPTMPEVAQSAVAGLGDEGASDGAPVAVSEIESPLGAAVEAEGDPTSDTESETLSPSAVTDPLDVAAVEATRAAPAGSERDDRWYGLGEDAGVDSDTRGDAPEQPGPPTASVWEQTVAGEAERRAALAGDPDSGPPTEAVPLSELFGDDDMELDRQPSEVGTWSVFGEGPDESPLGVPDEAEDRAMRAFFEADDEADRTSRWNFRRR